LFVFLASSKERRRSMKLKQSKAHLCPSVFCEPATNGYHPGKAPKKKQSMTTAPMPLHFSCFFPFHTALYAL
jgi:hypothetical protein